MSNIDRISIKDAPRLMEAVVQEVQVQLGVPFFSTTVGRLLSQ